jgi:hypothetical protein
MSASTPEMDSTPRFADVRVVEQTITGSNRKQPHNRLSSLYKTVRLELLTAVNTKIMVLSHEITTIHFNQQFCEIN